jgi:hypothetical protein
VTRLDSAIRRLTAQRALLDWAAGDTRGRPGLILELGLGNGRTYDHLRDRLPGRDIWAFELKPAAHPDSTPPADRLVVGDMLDTLPPFLKRFGPGCAAFIHADIGTGVEERNRRFAQALSPLVEPLLAKDAILAADQAMTLPNCRDISGETALTEGRYFVYRR